MKIARRILGVVFSTALAFVTVQFVQVQVPVSNRSLEQSKLESLAKTISELRGAAELDRERKSVIQKVMVIIEKYNPALPVSVKYAIANEIYKMSQKYQNLNPDLICATITHESAATWNPHVVSHKGAMGLMQIMPSTGRYLAEMENITWTTAEDVLFNPILNIRLGSRYLSELIEIYGVEGGLAAYNGGEKRAAMWLANNKANGILWSETQKYVPAIMQLYDHYKN